ncbi:MAG: hypothetical protein GY771_15520, partial [bacterium]|nr:hypothetical protein [bacterium]
MRYLLVLTVVFSTVALAAMDTHLEGEPDCSGVSNFAGAKDVLVDHLTPTDQVQGISMYGPNDWWCAIDWSPSGGDCTWNEWAFHYIALGAHPYDLNIEVCDTDLNTTPIDSFTIPEGDITVT